MASVLATGTVIEKYHGNDYARAHIYGAWWFYVLLAVVGLYALVSLIRLLRRKALRDELYKGVLYASVLLMLAGGALTAGTGRHGSVRLQPGVATSTYAIEGGDEEELPFALTLQHFEVVTYPGTRTPMDFVSYLEVEGEPVEISMNKIYKREGYRFYQEDYDEEGNSTLSVAHDPWGIAVTYAGYLLMLVGIVLCFVQPGSRYRRLLKGGVKTAVLIMALCGTQLLQAAPQTLPRETADKMGQMYVLYKGRVCPLQTLAKDFTTKLYGKSRYEGLTSEQVLSGYLFYFNEWVDEPVIKVKDDEMRRLLADGGRYTTYGDLMAHSDRFASAGSRGMMGGGMEAGSMPSKAERTMGEKYSLVQMLMGGKFLKMFPVQDSLGTLGWYAQNDDLPFTVADDEYFFVRKSLGYCQELVVKGDFAELERVFEKTVAYQQKRAGAVLPTPARFGAERLYNRLTTGRWLAMVAVTLGLLFFALALLRDRKERPGRAPEQTVCMVLVALLTLFLLVVFVLRWISGGHVPMAGGFDSMNLMTIMIGLIVLAVTRRYAMAPSIGLLAMGLCQLVAMMSGSNPPVTNLMPVLSSPLLTLHVTVIMISYALFFFVMLNGLAALIAPARAEAMRRMSLLMLYPAVALLAIGIVVGAVWANISWGNYWSWDPKEVWALITLLVYSYPLLAMQEGQSRSRSFHIYCFCAFLSVVITSFGVNLLLGGVHAYN